MTLKALWLVALVSFSFGSLPTKAEEMPNYLDDQIIEIQNQLLAEGFQIISIGRTWLGRILIQASSGVVEREIVINRGSGQIIHDRQKKKSVANKSVEGVNTQKSDLIKSKIGGTDKTKLKKNNGNKTNLKSKTSKSSSISNKPKKPKKPKNKKNSKEKKSKLDKSK